MKADIAPLCTHHNKPMVRDNAASGIHIAEPFRHYTCSESGCLQRFAAGGYYEEGNKPKNSKPCPECGHQQYLAKRGEIRLDDVWLCSNEACPSGRVLS